MAKRLAGKMVLITGAGRGIGRAIAESLAAEGAELILTARTELQLQETAEKLKPYGITTHVLPCDLSQESSISQLTEAVKMRFGRLDILINNAGITHSGLLKETDTAVYDRCMAVNARAPFILCRDLMGLLETAPQGYIINISSVVGVKGYAHQTAYTASKHALRGMSIALAEELRATNIRVHVICPGGVETPMVTEVRPDIPPDELIGPHEIAELVLYLVTHQGNAVMDELHLRRKTSSPWF